MTSVERSYFKALRKQKLIAAKYILDTYSFRGIKDSVTEKYTDQAHFVYELLQNADDAQATYARFILERDRLIFAHNGKRHFSVSDPDREEEDNKAGRLGDINAITGIGNSNKTGDSNKIGKFGVGFKAVFQYTMTPHIYDPNVFFKIERFFIPDLLTADFPGRMKDETLFVFPFDHPKRNAQIAFNDISDKLCNLSFPLLFLNTLAKLDYSIDSVEGTYTKELLSERTFRSTAAERLCFVSQFGNNKRKEDNLWLFSRNLKDNLRYSVGFAVDKEGTLTSLKTPAFCYFPTKESTGLNFVIQAPFLLTDSREGIRAGSKHNDSLIQKLAELAAFSLICLCKIERELSAKKRLVEDSVLDILPIREMEFSDPADKSRVSFRPFYSEIHRVMQTEPVLPAENGYMDREHAYWAANRGFTKVFDDEHLTEIVDDDKAKWVFRTLGRDDLQRANQPLMAYIDDCVKSSLTEEAIIRGRADDEFYDRHRERWIKLQPIPGIRPEFIEKQSCKWLNSFYGWILESKQRTELIRRRPVFLNQEGKASSAFDNRGNAMLYLPVKGVEGYNVISAELLKQPEAKKLLQELGVNRPELKDQIFHKILPLYDQEGTLDVSEHLKLFFKYYCECSSDDAVEFVRQLKTKSFLYCQNGITGNIKRQRPDLLYLPTEELIQYFGKTNAWYVALEHCKNVLKLTTEKEEKFLEFLDSLGVRKYPEVEKRKFKADALSSRYRSAIRVPYSTVYPAVFEEPVIHGCKQALEIIHKKGDRQLSYILWKMLVSVQRNESGLSYYYSAAFWGTCYYHYRTDKTERFQSTDVYELKNTKWLYTKAGLFAKPGEITIDELDDGYETADYYASAVIKLLGILEKAPIQDDRFDYSALPEEAQDAYLFGQQMKEAGLTKEDIPAFLEFKKMKDKKAAAGNDGQDAALAAGEDEAEDDDNKSRALSRSPAQRKRESMLKEILDKTGDKLEESKVLQIQDYEDDYDDLLPRTIDYSAQLEREKAKSAVALDKITRLDDLQKAAQKAPKYSYAWFKALLELEELSSNQNNQNSREISITFGKVERDQGTESYLVLSQPSRYIPQYMEDLADIPLLLQFPDKNRKIVIEVTSVRGYTLRVKLKDREALKGIELKNVKEASINASSPVFLIQALRKGFAALKFKDHFDMQKNLGRNIEFVFGPPGTGKTTYLARNVLLPLIKEGKPKILVLTPTNKAADVLTMRIMQCATKKSDYLSWLVRFGTTDDASIESCGVYRERTFDMSSLEKMIVVTTIARLPYDKIVYGADHKLIQDCNWDYVIIDEASMIPLANIVYSLYKLQPKKFIIAGDPFQIEPITTVNLWKNENIYKFVKLDSFVKPETVPYPYEVHLLTTQYRSIPAIGSLFSKMFYGGVLGHNRSEESQLKLSTGDDPAFHTVNIIKYPVSSYESIYRPKRLQKSSSYQVYSALLVFEYVTYLSKLLSRNNPNKKIGIGIISPYRAQADLIDKLLASEKIPERIRISVGTIHSFQGDECEIIFAVFNTPPRITGSQELFLNNKNILNVSISRAKDYLFLVMPNEDTEGIENLKLINHLEKMCRESGNCGVYSSQQLELRMYRNTRFLEENSFTTSHQNVNVYGLPEKTYEIRTEENAIDVQVHREQKQREVKPSSEVHSADRPAASPELTRPSDDTDNISPFELSISVKGELTGNQTIYVYPGKLKDHLGSKGIQMYIVLNIGPVARNIPVVYSASEKKLYIWISYFRVYEKVIRKGGLRIVAQANLPNFKANQNH